MRKSTWCSKDRVGAFSNVTLEYNHILATHQELRGRGVKFKEEPNERPWGIGAQFREADGDEFNLIRR